MRLDLSPQLIAAGASNEPAGTHTSRTMMLDELEALLDGCPPAASYDEYASAIVDDNLLRKATVATRRKSLRHLRELYALRASVPLFGGMRELWHDDPESRPLLAVLCAAARDPLVRASFDVVADSAIETPLEAPAFARAIGTAFPGKFSPGVQSRIGRNLASTWTQSGHLHAARRAGPKVRARVAARPAAAIYAMYLGHLDGQAGFALLATPWAAMLDADPSAMRGLAEEGGRRGWLDYASSGGMLEIGFSHLDNLLAAGAA